MPSRLPRHIDAGAHGATPTWVRTGMALDSSLVTATRMRDCNTNVVRPWRDEYVVEIQAASALTPASQAEQDRAGESPAHVTRWTPDKPTTDARRRLFGRRRRRLPRQWRLQGSALGRLRRRGCCGIRGRAALGKGLPFRDSRRASYVSFVNEVPLSLEDTRAHPRAARTRSAPARRGARRDGAARRSARRDRRGSARREQRCPGRSAG
jgi:hypothetical protein